MRSAITNETSQLILLAILRLLPMATGSLRGRL